MTRTIALAGGAVGAALTLLSIFVLPWSQYGDIEIPLNRFTGWPVYVASALAFLAVVAWALFLPARWPGARLAVAIACALAAVVSAIVLGSRYDNAPDLFDTLLPLAMVKPAPGMGPFVAVLAVLVSAVGLVPARSRA
ncbi:MAG TPA: hypothetical protein VFC19_45290 [Candidatus Limnocylindrales bacterium]|nr:hypothetical protein [Candidatus Limnocylindrales bacterium]